MRYTHEGRTINRVEWFSPSTREWRTEEGARVTIYGLDRYAIVTPTGGTYLRRGGARVMGYHDIPTPRVTESTHGAEGSP